MHCGTKRVFSMREDKLNELVHTSETRKKECDLQSSCKHVLIVGSDILAANQAKDVLEPIYHVSCVDLGSKVLDYIKVEMPDIILLDFDMSEMEAFLVNTRLKETEAGAEIPVVLISTDESSELEIRAFEAGMLDVITKPLDSDISIRRIQRVLKVDQMQKKMRQDLKEQTREAHERRMQVERLSLQIMEALADTIDAKDRYTNGHSVRVAEYSRELARRLGKSQKEQKDFYYMGLLHDIGKIGIPDQIIRKNSRLSDEEYGIIKSHPVIGEEILKNISEIPGIETGARWHHEKYDGTGYPDGLKGKEIPLVARIIGVADAYDAMASKRSYRDVLPQKVVREEILKGKGTQFDPEIAEKMIEMIDEDKGYKLRERDV